MTKSSKKADTSAASSAPKPHDESAPDSSKAGDPVAAVEAATKGQQKVGKRTSTGPADNGKAKEAASVRGKKARAGMSGLDAAATVLAGAAKPMHCKELVERVFAKGLWKTKGKTPAATIHAAMIREIRDKGKKSRFRKVGRGTFTATAARSR